jgi:hypothetical protein
MNSSVPIDNPIVSGSRSTSSSETGFCQAKDWPKSPCTRMFVIHFQYCTIIGSFSP